jgi:hypothetical protein
VRNYALIFTLAFLSVRCLAQAPRSSVPSPAAVSASDGIFSAFHRSPLVGLSDYHALAQEEDFYITLISDARFANEVGNVVVEFGNASQQQAIDRYVSGEDMPYSELRKVWGDTSYVGWFPTVTALGYLNFYAAVRSVNAKLPVEKRIHVWLGGKPVDWSTIKTKEDLSKVVSGLSDQYPADLIEHQILAKNKKALVIYGTFHFYDKGSLAEIIRQRHPGSLFVITPYTGFGSGSCSEQFETHTTNRSLPALLVAEQLAVKQTLNDGCRILDASGFAEMTEVQRAKIRAEMEHQTAVLAGNALLYLAPARLLTKSPLSPDLYLDPEFRKENDRRARLFLVSPIGGHR